MFSLIDTYKKVNFVFNKTFTSYVPFLFLFILLTFMELLSIGLIIPYINLIFNPELLLEYEFIKNLKIIEKDFDLKKLIILSSFLFGLIFLLKSIFIIFVRAQIQKFSLGSQKKLQIELMQTYQNMKYEEFNKKKQSEYIRNIRELSANSMTCLEMGLRVSSELIVIFAIISFLLFIEPLPLIIISLIVFLSILIYNFYLKPMAIKWGKEKTDATKLIYQSVDESFKGFKSIQSLGKQNFFSEFLKKGANKIFKNDLKSSIIISSPRYFLELVLVIFLVSYLSLSVISKGIDSNIFPALVIFALAGLRILPSAAIISNGILLIGYCNEALNIIYFDLKKYNNSITLTLGKNYLFPEESFILDIREALKISKFIGQQSTEIKLPKIPLRDFLSLFLQTENTNIRIDDTNIILEFDEKKYPSKISLNHSDIELVILVKKIWKN